MEKNKDDLGGELADIAIYLLGLSEILGIDLEDEKQTTLYYSYTNMPGIKDENYKIVPIIDGQMNLEYFEQLCYIYDKDNREVGMSFVELLPGVYNKKLDGKLLLKKV